jgi:glycosyltransferase involved in cell wall biosynthesis
MDAEPLVTVVTPVYNTGKYLEQAIRSVLAQSYKNWEYIICNNHSTDNSGEIAARYAQLDPRIRVVTPPQFLPQSANFNFAFRQISPDSRYTKMIFGDDRLLPNCLREMVTVAESSPSIAMVSSYRLVEADGDCFGLPLDETVIPGRVAGRLHLLNGIFLFGTPSTVLYRSHLVRSRSPQFYPEDRFYFDTDVAFQLLVDHDFGFVHQVLTFSRYQPDSITHKEQRFYSREVDRIICLHSYGRQYLTEAEYDRSLARARRVYYEGLGRGWLTQWLGGPSTEFWEYHRERLSGVGLKIEPARLAWGTCCAFLRTLASPFDLIRGIVRSRRPAENPWRA